MTENECLNGGGLQGFGSVVRSCTWQDILNTRGYVIIVPTCRDERVEIGVPITFTVTSGNLGDLAPGLLLPIMETTFADFLEQA